MRYNCNAINAIRKVRDSVEETKCAALVCSGWGQVRVEGRTGEGAEERGGVGAVSSWRAWGEGEDERM